jgi:hypothetical protein
MSCDFEEMFGPVVGHGSQATVYAKGEYAVKLYREGYPKANVFSEAYVMSNLERENFPSPKIYEVLLVNGRYGLRMERIRGKMMGEGLAGDPVKVKDVLKVLVNLQCRLQKHGNAGDWAPDIKLRFRNDLVRNDRLSDDMKKRLLGILKELPDGRALCHCDFHFGNIFHNGAEYIIVDLVQISKGDPAADAVCSYVSYSLMHHELGEYYLDRYCEISEISRKNVLRWLPVYAGTLLGQLPEQYTPIIEKFINADETME